MKRAAALAVLGVVSLAAPARAEDASRVPNPDKQTIAYSDGFVIQNDWGNVRLYPRASVTVDGRATFGPSAMDVRGTDGGTELTPRVVLRRSVFELGGSAFGFLDMKVSVELDGRGTYGDKLLPNPHDLRVGIPNAWINAEAGPALNLMVGMQPVPFSLERRTDPDDLYSIEPSLASQLGSPYPRAIGATIWGTSLHRRFGYDVMGITGTGTTIPTSFAERGAAGRVFVRPLALDTRWWNRFQIGASLRWTVRDGQSADMSRDDVTTGNGFALLRRRFVDSLGRTEAILPSGNQRAFGVELRAPIWRGLDLTGEVYVFDDETREAVQASAASSTERLGAMHGTGWYAEASYFFEPVRPPDPIRLPSHHDVPYELTRALDGGLYPHPRRAPLVVQSPIEALTTLGFTVRAGRLVSTYDPTRNPQTTAFGVPDANSPGGRAEVWEIGGSMSVWATRIFRFTAAWQSYVAPSAGTPQNRAVVAGQIAGQANAEWMHELTLRARMSL